MPRIAIVTDSSACLPAALLREYGIAVVPLAVNFKGEVYHDGEIAPDQFIQRLRASEDYPTTAAPAPGEFLDAFSRARQAGAEAVLCLTLSSRYSGTFGSAAQATELATQKLAGFPVRVVDTGGIAMAHGLAVLEAARAAEAGANLEETVTVAERAGTESNLVGLLDGTRYLAKSGRVPRLLHLAASALGVKPLIASTKGTIGAAGRVRTHEQGMERLVQFVKDRTVVGARIRMAVMHAGAPEHARALAERVKRVLSPEELLETEFTPAMAVHTGPGFVGLAWQTLEPAAEPAVEKRRSYWRRRDIATLTGAVGPLPSAVERPSLVVLSGLPGSGKSHLAREISARYPLAVLASDALRRALVKRPTYSQKESARLFAAVHGVLEDLLSRGVPALLDATNLKEMHRQPLYEIAARTGARLLVVEVRADDEMVRQRLNARRARENPADISEATVEVYEMMREEAEPITRPHLVVDTSADELGPAVDRIVSELVQVRS